MGSEDTKTVDQDTESTSEARTLISTVKEREESNESEKHENDSIPPFLSINSKIGRLSDYIKNPDDIAENTPSILESSLLLYYVLLIAIPKSVYREVNPIIRILLSAVIGGYIFNAWDSVVNFGSIGNTLLVFTHIIASIDPGILLLSSIMLVFGTFITYYLHRLVTTDSSEHELQTDGSGRSKVFHLPFEDELLIKAIKIANNFSTIGAIVGLLTGMLIGGIFNAQLVVPTGIVGIVIGEEIGYRMKS